MTDNQYAYGADVVENEQGEECECPSVTAGYETKTPYASRVAGEFDEKLRGDSFKGQEGATGVVDEETAKEAWLDMLEDVRDKDWQEYERFAEEVAEELGWLQ